MGVRIFGLIPLPTFLCHAWQLAGLLQRLWLLCMILCVVMWYPNLGCLFRLSNPRVAHVARMWYMLLTLSSGCAKSCLVTVCSTVCFSACICRPYCLDVDFSFCF